MTEDEVKAWRENMTKFDETVSDARKEGLEDSAESLHDEIVKEDGVLPPL